MPAGGIERQRLDPAHRGRIEIAIKMREQRAAPRRFPAERGAADAVDAHRDEQQVVHAGKVFRGGLTHLACTRRRPSTT
mgnify:CR=1 FL=1